MKNNLGNHFALCALLLSIALASLAPYSAYAQKESTPIPNFTPLLDGIKPYQGKASPEVLDFANRLS
ncbi:hypothetical protein L1047_10415 [Synechococcus sp. Nb3U1]|uniref:hypothetical protein n=1 Tax=Synechococcus sp. Nb3U1 TaxID=1914529 RepID=UPI001F1732A2|nr:hypothetical protein [Synechococcus sp. Nb3U1]MCF2971608.1 hypothetical protein [Synechococcus sp. Nb3U1]